MLPPSRAPSARGRGQVCLRGNEQPLPGIPKMDRWNVKHFLDESQAAESNSAAKGSFAGAHVALEAADIFAATYPCQPVSPKQFDSSLCTDRRVVINQAVNHPRGAVLSS